MLLQVDQLLRIAISSPEVAWGVAILVIIGWALMGHRTRTLAHRFHQTNLKLEQRLKQQNQLLQNTRNQMSEYKAILDSTPVILITIDQHHTIKMINQFGANKLGYSETDLTGQKFTRLLPISLQARFTSQFDKIRNYKIPPRREIDVPLLSRTGNEIIFRFHCHFVCNDQGNVIEVFIAGTEILADNDVAKVCTKIKAQAQKACQAQSLYYANLCHELRNPLNIISGYSQLIEKNKANLPPHVQTYLDYILTSSQNMLVIFETAIDLAKEDAGKISVQKEPLNLKTLVANIYQTNCPFSQSKGIDFCYTIDENLPDEIVGDPTKLTQILVNLCVNALKFTPTGGKVELKVLKQHDKLKMVVQDNGIGIPKNKQKTIFTPFEQIDNPGPQPQKGSGLGLSIARGLITKMGGSIKVKSEMGTGSTFSVLLPLAPVSGTSIDIGAAPANDSC